MRRSERDEWVADLRSGEFPQGEGSLVVTGEDGGKTYCCLGVKCERDSRTGRHSIVRQENEQTGEVSFGIPNASTYLGSTMPTSAILTAWGLPAGQATDLANMNDEQGKSFAEIADWIEANVPVEDDDTTAS
jgi:hypothetical protein